MFKRKKNEKGEELENFIDVFLRNYRAVPAFKALVKLGLYFFAIIIILAGVSFGTSATDTETNGDTKTNTTETTTKKIVYNDILEGLKKDNISIYATIKVYDLNYVIDAVNNESILTGYLETDEETKKIKITEDKDYEVSLKEEKESSEIFENIDRDFIIPNNLVKILIGNRATKLSEDDVEVYNYKINKNNIDYEIKVYVKESNCFKIEIINEARNYLITYK